MFVSDKFLELLKVKPDDLIREQRVKRNYYTEESFYLIKMHWVVQRTTIDITLKDAGSFSKEKTPTLMLQSIKLAKKKYYGLYTDRTEVERDAMSDETRKRVVNALSSHYFDTPAENWQDIANGGPTVDDYL